MSGKPYRHTARVVGPGEEMGKGRSYAYEPAGDRWRVWRYDRSGETESHRVLEGTYGTEGRARDAAEDFAALDNAP